MSQLTFTLNDGNKIPFLAFGTGTSLAKQDVTEPAILAIEKGYTHLDGAQVRKHNHLPAGPEGLTSKVGIVLSERRNSWCRHQGIRKTQRLSLCNNQA